MNVYLKVDVVGMHNYNNKNDGTVNVEWMSHEGVNLYMDTYIDLYGYIGWILCIYNEQDLNPRYWVYGIWEDVGTNMCFTPMYYCNYEHILRRYNYIKI